MKYKYMLGIDPTQDNEHIEGSVKQWKDAALLLYQLLEDIDTYTDMYKAPVRYKLLDDSGKPRQLTENEIKRNHKFYDKMYECLGARFEIFESDGYKLFWRGTMPEKDNTPSIPQDDGLRGRTEHVVILDESQK